LNYARTATNSGERAQQNDQPGAMHILTLDAALLGCSAAIVRDDEVLAQREQPTERGQATMLPIMVEAVLDEARVLPAELELIAATVGPGSFTGIRAALALAHGIGLAARVPVIAVTMGEALAEALPHLGHRHLWFATDSARGHLFLERAGSVLAIAPDHLPVPDGPVAIAGTAAIEVAARLAARDADVMLTDAKLPQPRHIAMAARRRHAGELPPRAALPLYVDPPAVRLPAGGLRPPPLP
jgi:tRNA threonylcarbamoyladenosine biosynthesis protein TsaB